MLVRYKQVFEYKHNEKNEIIRYKARLVAQDFSYKLGIDYEETYSLIVDAITFRLFFSLVITKSLYMHLMDSVPACLYKSLDNNIQMKIPKRYKISETCNSNS